MEKIGFIGLGIMGRPMAINLIKAEHEVIVYDIVPEAMQEFAKECEEQNLEYTEVNSCKDVASKSDVVITMVQNSPEVKEAVLGPNGVLEGADPGTIYIDMSSIDPLVSQEISAECAKKEVTMLDAPVSGGEPKAISGDLAIMVGGPEDAFYEVKDILDVMGGSVTRVGDIGSGNTTKLANQIMVAVNGAGMSEAMALVTRAGVDPEKVFNAIKGGLAGSAFLNAKMPLILEGKFKPGFRIKLHIKDLQNALNAAHSLGVPVPMTAGVMEIMQGLKTAGHDGDDHGGIIQWYEQQADVQVRRTKG